MTAPKYVPSGASTKAKYYTSPPESGRTFTADRPGEIDGEQPRGARFGSQGPDQGFVLRLAHIFKGQLFLTEGEHEEDALAGAAQVGLQRASLFGRAPVVHDLRIGLVLWGFLTEDPPADLVAERKWRFAGVSHSHDPMARHLVTEGINDDLLRQTPQQIEDEWRNDWRAAVLNAGGDADPSTPPEA